ncbi:MAG: hypothetical protein IJD10_06140, partial [Clostridia bacterium]|nr:hypothetical protein [Clostridia bacterium]
MKHKFSKQILSALLAFVMVIGLIPASTLTALAVGNVVVTHDVDEIRELLRQDGDVSIKLDADANKTIVSTHENRDDEKEYEEGTIFDTKKVWTRIGSGNKTIDLNGHRLYVTETLDSRAGVWKAVMMEIPTGASLTVNDSAGGGLIWFDAEMYDPDDIYYEGNSGIKIRDTFYVTGGDLTVNGGEIHAGRARRVWAYYVAKVDKNWQWIGSPWYEEWYEGRDETPEDNGYHNWYYTGYATQFNSGTAITAYDGNVTINGGNFWGRGWDNYTIISRVPNNPNGPDDHRDRCAALRVKGGQVTINAGEFYGRSDADAIQVLDPADLTVNSGTFDVSTNDYLTEPFLYYELVTVFHSSRFDVHMGNLGSFGVPTESINDQSVKVTKGNTMTLSKNAIDPYIVIDDLTLYVNAPLDYSDISTEVYRVPEGCTVESVTWYKNGAKIENPESTYFQEGQRYSVYIALSVNNQTGTKFTNRLNDATINGKEAEINRVDDENLILSVDFGYCTAALEDLEFEVIEPAEGQYANSWVDTSEYELYAPVGGYSNYGDFRTWYVSDDGENWTEKSTDDVFEAGKYYRFSFEVHAGEGQEFALDGNLDPDVSVTVNGITAATVKRVYDQDPSEHILVQVDFGQCPALISYVELTVTAPKEGETISYTVGSAQDTYYAIGDNSNYTDYRAWYESDTGYDNWRLMSPGETFTAGKYYKFVTDVYTTPGYEFPLYDNGVSIMPGVNAYVNGYAANVFKGYEQDPSRYITVEYFFGICNDSVVENIIIENVTAPVAGEKPNYNWSIRGNGYQMDTTKNAYYDVYWKNPPEQWYYIKNGLGWFDVTDYDWVYENETFIAGHEYEVRVYVITEDGFEFAHNNYYEPTVTATVNGNTAEAIVDGSYCVSTQQIEYTFTCTQPEINTIMLYNLDAPVAGETPDTEMTAAYPEYYTVTNVTWLDEEDGVVNSFEQGRLYTAEITVAAKDYDGVDGCIFADTVTAYIDGKEVTGWTNSVTNINNTLTVRYSFRNGASAPEVGCSVSGTVTSFNDTEGEVTLQLYYGESVNPSYETIVKGNSVDYSFADVVAGTYTMKVSKANHVTREYTVVVGDTSVLQDVKIHL